MHQHLKSLILHHSSLCRTSPTGPEIRDVWQEICGILEELTPITTPATIPSGIIVPPQTLKKALNGPL